MPDATLADKAALAAYVDAACALHGFTVEAEERARVLQQFERIAAIAGLFDVAFLSHASGQLAGVIFLFFASACFMKRAQMRAGTLPPNE